jgi:hypothetical protein
MCAQVCVYTYVCTSVCVHLCVHKCVCVCVYTCTLCELVSRVFCSPILTPLGVQFLFRLFTGSTPGTYSVRTYICTYVQLPVAVVCTYTNIVIASSSCNNCFTKYTNLPLLSVHVCASLFYLLDLFLGRTLSTLFTRRVGSRSLLYVLSYVYVRVCRVCDILYHLIFIHLC